MIPEQPAVVRSNPKGSTSFQLQLRWSLWGIAKGWSQVKAWTAFRPLGLLCTEAKWRKFVPLRDKRSGVQAFWPTLLYPEGVYKGWKEVEERDRLRPFYYVPLLGVSNSISFQPFECPLRYVSLASHKSTEYLLRKPLRYVSLALHNLRYALWYPVLLCEATRRSIQRGCFASTTSGTGVRTLRFGYLIFWRCL